MLGSKLAFVNAESVYALIGCIMLCVSVVWSGISFGSAPSAINPKLP